MADSSGGMMVTATGELTIVRGVGTEVWDDTGRRYIDCVAGQGSANLGHCHPAVVRAVQEQAARLMSCPATLGNDARSELLRRLAEVTPPGLDRFFLCNSGTEAVGAGVQAGGLTTGGPGL